MPSKGRILLSAPSWAVLGLSVDSPRCRGEGVCYNSIILSKNQGELPLRGQEQLQSDPGDTWLLPHTVDQTSFQMHQRSQLRTNT